MNLISNIISNSVAGFVEAGTRTAGGYAGDAIIRTGDLIESTGRGVGTSMASRRIHLASQVRKKLTWLLNQVLKTLRPVMEIN